MSDLKNVGIFGVLAYFLFIVGIFGIIQALFLGDYKNDDLEWVTVGDSMSTVLFIFIIGIIFFIIDRMRSNKW